MINNIIIKSRVDDLDLNVNYIMPNTSIRGLTIIVHGMTEHKERYNYFLEQLALNGYVSVAYDQRGHGKSIRSNNDLGYFYTEDETAFREDLHTIIEFFKYRYQTQNTIIFAHSMGTLVTRSFIEKYDNMVNKVILCGPPTKNSLVDLGLLIAKISKSFDKGRKPNKLLNELTLGKFNKGYDKPNSWLSKNPNNVDNYNNDPVCDYIFTTNGFINLYKLQKSAFQSKDYAVNNKNLVILLLAGSDDPVIGNLKKFKNLERFMKKLGYLNVTSKVYDSLRHELLQEEEKDIIIKDIISFINN